ncbi:hypothetical protein N7510_005279 [Penicillium lagena]|uniref:uncharacterized protein n=1 Tax=Penicillium lagena TaxID=94218 RepID=UPI00254050CF|nr:uncharacterized protein N7510_005279 [Penicillium lagena]KAJ5612085.1 hypothetical protein N7510_005279 [Penicillium lagena]
MDDSKSSDIVDCPEAPAIPHDPRFEITWEAVDPENPRTWSVWYRSFIVASMSFSTTIVNIYYHVYLRG